MGVVTLNLSLEFHTIFWNFDKQKFFDVDAIASRSLAVESQPLVSASQFEREEKALLKRASEMEGMPVRFSARNSYCKHLVANALSESDTSPGAKWNAIMAVVAGMARSGFKATARITQTRWNTPSSLLSCVGA